MASTAWYVPGWMWAEVSQEDVMPGRKCIAWGGKGEMTAAFEKVEIQVK